MSMCQSAKKKVSFQLNQWIVTELSLDMPCAGSVKELYYFIWLAPGGGGND